MKKPEVSNQLALTLRNLRKEILLNESFVDYSDYSDWETKDLIMQCTCFTVPTSGAPFTVKKLDSIYLELISRKAPFALKVKQEQFSSWLVANKNSIQELKEFFNVK